MTCALSVAGMGEKSSSIHREARSAAPAQQPNHPDQCARSQKAAVICDTEDKKQCKLRSVVMKKRYVWPTRIGPFYIAE